MRDELKLLVTSDALRKVTKEVCDTKAELERVQAIAQKVKADADVMAVAEKLGREAQRLLLKKLKDSRDKISGARDLVTAAREETSIFRNRVDVAFAKEKKARREATEAQLEIAEAEGRASVAETKAIDALNEGTIWPFHQIPPTVCLYKTDIFFLQSKRAGENKKRLLFWKPKTRKTRWPRITKS